MGGTALRRGAARRSPQASDCGSPSNCSLAFLGVWPKHEGMQLGVQAEKQVSQLSKQLS